MHILRLAPVTLLAILFPAVVSFGGALGENSLFCTGGTARGANIDHGLALASTSALFIGCLFVLTWLLSADLWRWRRLIAGACVLEAALLLVAIALVALDSATYISRECGFGFGDSSTSVGHVGWLYFAWGFAIAALLYLALRIVNYSPAPPGPEGEPDVPGLPLD
jgi:hypothetical protein